MNKKIQILMKAKKTQLKIALKINLQLLKALQVQERLL